MPYTEVQKNRNELAELFTGIGVEVGTERGLYAEVIAKYATKLYCVDPWLAYPGYREHVSQEKLDGFYDEARARLPLHVELVRKTSLEAAQLFDDEELDFVYIDANHAKEHVLADVQAWLPKVKKGGILAGHDFVRKKGLDHMFGVKDALNELGLTDALTIYTGDRSPSWMYVRPLDSHTG